MVFGVTSCPRCVRPVPPGAARCPTCGYDPRAAELPAAQAPGNQVADEQPATRPPPVGGLAAGAPWDPTVWTPPPQDEGAGLIPGLTEGPPRGTMTGPSSKPGRYWWGVGAAALAGVALLVVIGVLAATRIGHRAAGDDAPVTPGVLAPTGGISTSNSPSASASASASGSGSGSTRPAGRQPGVAQASVIAGYLTQSGQARQGIGTAISAISRCTDIPAAVTTLENAADVRTRILAGLASADVSALPNGAAAVADLSRAMQASADADRHYAAWGQTIAGCRAQAPHNAEFVAAQQADITATAAKQRFADEWNPIAARYGLAQQSANTI
jgi:hypothetical protein